MARVPYDKKRPPGPAGGQHVVRVEPRKKAKKNFVGAMVLVEQPKQAALQHHVERVGHYAEAAQADNTRRAYMGDWNRFVDWCRAQGTNPLPAAPSAVASYLAHLADEGKKASTIDRALASISAKHTADDYDSPRKTNIVSKTLAGIHSRIGTAPEQKAPVLVDTLKRIIRRMDLSELTDIRDRALILVGFAGAFRRSELANLDVGDIIYSPQGLTIHIRRSKTDQKGRGRKIGIPHGSDPATDPVTAYRDWIEAAGIDDGPAFRAVRGQRASERRMSDRTVARIIKRAALDVGLSPEEFAGHSLRSGFVTSAARAKVSDRNIMKQTGHKSHAMVSRYVRDATVFDDNAVKEIL